MRPLLTRLKAAAIPPGNGLEKSDRRKGALLLLGARLCAFSVCSRRRSLHRIGLVVKLDDLLRNVNRIRGIDHRCGLRAPIDAENNAVAVLFGIFAENR